VSPSARRLVLVIVAGVAVLAAFSVYADVRELGQRLRGFGWSAFALAVGLALVNYALRLLRWSLYLAHADLAVPLRSRSRRASSAS
jgi:uncharacterized membrane protein YbhN (UPF0104 family)